MHHIHHHQHRHPADQALHAGHMERFSKRRRVEGRSPERVLESHGTEKELAQDIEVSLPEQDRTRGRLPKLVLPPSGDKAFDIVGSPRQEAGPRLGRLHSTRLPLPKLELRQDLPAVGQVAGQTTGIVGAAAAPVMSAVNGAANDLVNNASSSAQPPANISDTNNAASPVPTPTNPGYVQPPAAIAAENARSSALAVEEKQAMQDDRLPPPPASSLVASEASSPAAAASTATAQNSMSIQVPALGSSSQQQVLSSPPTPLPSTPDASANSAASSSYFTSSPSSAGITASSRHLAPQSNVPSAIRSSSTNSTMSSSSLNAAVTSSVLSSMNSASSSIDAALLASMSASRASRSSLEAMSSSVTGFNSLTASESLTGSVASPTTMTTMASSFATEQTGSATGSGAASTEAGIGGIGGATSTTGAPASSSSTASASTGGSSTPATPALIGGIVGGISGLVLILLAALLLLRWRKGRLGSGERRTISPPMLQTSSAGAAPQSGTGTTGTQRSSTAPIAAAGFFGRLRPSSSQTATTADTAPSERGFQKISGRKLPSVLTSGGDGYGEKVGAGAAGAAAGADTGGAAASKGVPSMPQQRGVAPGQGPFAGLASGVRPSPTHSLSGSSFYRDSRGFYGGVVPPDSTSGAGATEPSSSPTSSSPTFPSPLAVAGGAKDPGIPSRKPTMRPGPARTPVINTPGAVAPPRPVQGTPPPASAQNPRDLLGRSHPSEDGSRASRFKESTTPP